MAKLIKIRFASDGRDEWVQVDEAVAKAQKRYETILRCNSWERDGADLVARVYEMDRNCPHCYRPAKQRGTCPSMFHRNLGN